MFAFVVLHGLVLDLVDLSDSEDLLDLVDLVFLVDSIASDPAMDEDSTDDEERKADPLRIHVHVHRQHGIPSSDSGVEIIKDDCAVADVSIRLCLVEGFASVILE